MTMRAQTLSRLGLDFGNLFVTRSRPLPALTE